MKGRGGMEVTKGGGEKEGKQIIGQKVINNMESTSEKRVKEYQTSDAGSQYRCRRMGRDIQPSSTPHAPPQPTHISKKASKTLVFPLFDSWVTDQQINGQMDRWTDKASYRVACPLDGTIKLFFRPRKNGIGEKFTFYVYFEIKKSLSLISQFNLPRSDSSEPSF